MSPKKLLEAIYDPATFAHNGKEVLQLLEGYLADNLEARKPRTIAYQSPEEMLAYWDSYKESDPIQLIKDFMEHSIHIHHPHYMGHQVVPPAPDTALVSMVGALLNNGGAVYEMGMASNALEKLVTDTFLPYFGYEVGVGGGVFTSGGTLANLTACLCARAHKGDGVWEQGTQERYGFIVSSEAHYCIDRAVRIMGWGSSGMVTVPVDDAYCMRVDLLPEVLGKAQQKGIKVIGVVGSAPSTSTGNYDDLEAIGRFAEQHDLWFHVDAAHGGPAVFSSKYSHLMKGCHHADSITVDGHKMMMMPGLTTKLFFKEEKASFKTFAQEASYLWEDSLGDWYNPGKRTFECTKLIMSLRYQIILQQYGMEAFEAFVDECYDNGRMFYQLVSDHPSFEAAVEPHSNIVCFRPIAATSLAAISSIRKQLVSKGHYYIVQTTLDDEAFLRVSLMNPFTTRDHMKDLLASILKYSDKV